MIKQMLLSLLSLWMVLGVGAAQQSPPAKGSDARLPESAPAQKESAPQVSESYLIGLEDVLAISVWKEPEISTPQIVVRPDGKITLPLIGDVQAAGSTTRQLQESLTERLKEFVSAPTVTVLVLKIESQKVSIVGMVSKPGTYPLGGPLTVLELIARAGGLSEYAKAKNIKIVRKRDGSTINFNYNDAIKGKNLKQNVFLENGDIVMVP